MKKKIIITSAVTVVLLLGIVFVSAGFTSEGYNYKAHSYKGMYCDVYPQSSLCIGENSIRYSLKWNEAYMSSEQDENGEYIMHAGFETFQGSSATLSKQYSGKYIDPTTHEECRWNARMEIKAIPFDAVYNTEDRMWYSQEGEKLGKRYYEEGLMVTQIINNDNCFELSGLEFSIHQKDSAKLN